MNDISQEYLLLFNTITQASETLEQLRLQLMDAQQRSEEIYINKKAESA